MGKIDVKKATDILANVPKEKSFQLKDGRSLKNLYELHKVSSDMSDETFSHHAADDKNDFSNWVRYVHKDEELAKRLEEAKTQKEIQKFVRDRIEILHKIRGVKDKPKKSVLKKVKTVRPKKVKAIAVKPAAVRKVKKSLKLPLKLTLGESKLAEKRLCPHHYFMKCTSTHFVLGVVAGFLIGILIASI